MTEETQAEPTAVVEDGVRVKRGRPAKVKQAEPGEMVQMRVLKKGAGKISRGVHEAGEGDEFYDAGDTFYVPAESVDALEDRGLAESV